MKSPCRKRTRRRQNLEEGLIRREKDLQTLKEEIEGFWLK